MKMDYAKMRRRIRQVRNNIERGTRIMSFGDIPKTGKQEADNDSMYDRIMKSVAEIMNEA